METFRFKFKIRADKIFYRVLLQPERMEIVNDQVNLHCFRRLVQNFLGYKVSSPILKRCACIDMKFFQTVFYRVMTFFHPMATLFAAFSYRWSLINGLKTTKQPNVVSAQTIKKQYSVLCVMKMKIAKIIPSDKVLIERLPFHFQFTSLLLRT